MERQTIGAEHTAFSIGSRGHDQNGFELDRFTQFNLDRSFSQFLSPVGSLELKTEPSHPDHPVAGRDFPLVHQPAAGDDISAAVQSRRGADVGGYSQDTGPYRVAIGRGGVVDTSILVDRDGEVIGRYDKMFPTIPELEKGVIPGTVAPVFETDFGLVGLLICFDLNFPEVRVALKQSKPDLVVFSSLYRGGLQAGLAYKLRAFVVTSIASELGLIIDRAGRIIKESTYEALAVAPININSVAVHMDFNWTKMDAMLAKYGHALTFDYHTREAFFVIASAHDEDIEAIIKEFQLEPADAYFDRSRRVRAEMLEKFQKSRTARAGS